MITIRTETKYAFKRICLEKLTCAMEEWLLIKWWSEVSVTVSNCLNNRSFLRVSFSGSSVIVKPEAAALLPLALVRTPVLATAFPLLCLWVISPNSVKLASSLSPLSMSITSWTMDYKSNRQWSFVDKETSIKHQQQRPR